MNNSQPDHHPGKVPLWTGNFILLCLVNLTLFLAFQMLIPTLPVYVSEMGGSKTAVGLIIGIFTISAVVVRPFTGRLLDTHGRRGILLIGLAVFIVSTAAYHWAATVALVLAIRFIHGFGWGACTTAAGTAAADIIPTPRLAEGMGFFGLAATLSMTIAPAVGLYLIYNYSFGVLFAVSVALSILSLLLAAAVKYPNVAPAAKNVPDALFEPAAFRPSVVIFLCTTTYGAVVTFIALYAGQQGVPIDRIGILFTVFAITLTLTRPLAGMLVDRRGYDVVVVPGLLFVTATMIVLSQAAALWMFLLAGVLFGLGFGTIHPSMQAMAVQFVPPHRRGAANGTFFSAFDLGIGAGAIVWGAVSQAYDYSTMYLLAAGPGVLALAVYLVTGRQSSRDRATG
jgi:MFS family permease